jgi:hypothetical protein
MARTNYLKPKPKYLAETLRAYKKSSGMTSYDVGKAMNCTAENARAQMTKPAMRWSIRKLKRYCEVLNVPIEEALNAAAQELK